MARLSKSYVLCPRVGLIIEFKFRLLTVFTALVTGSYSASKDHVGERRRTMYGISLAFCLWTNPQLYLTRHITCKALYLQFLLMHTSTESLQNRHTYTSIPDVRRHESDFKKPGAGWNNCINYFFEKSSHLE